MVKGMLCDICIQLVTGFDAWLTDDKTEQDIVEYVEQVNKNVPAKVLN